MFFLIISNIDIDFLARDLQWRSYIIENALSITRQVELIEKKNFLATALNLEHKAFIVYVIILSVDIGDKMHLLKRAQIVYLKVDKALTKVFNKYIDFADVFLPKLVAKLFKHMRINKIKFMDN